jgi:phosphoglycerate dehydrogenase-like enzyme
VSASDAPVIVVEDDPFTRLIQVVLDPAANTERRAAFADFMAHDEPDFEGWCVRLRAQAGALAHAEVRLVENEEEMRANLADATVLVVESLHIGPMELAAAPRLKVVQKFGVTLRNIETAACEKAGIAVLTLRRRANIACAEEAFGMMLTLARKLHKLNGLITVNRLAKAGFPYRPFDRRHTPNGNWGRIPGMRMLNESTLGIIGLGEIGREIALRAAAFGMRTLYHQRTRLPEADERALDAQFVSLDQLLAESDWVIPQLPGSPATFHLIDRNRFAQMKPGACIINVSRADVVDRDALVEALASGRLGGFALDPLYEEPGRDDDDLLRFDNVILIPHMAGSPRFNALKDFEELIIGIARETTRC